MSRRLFFLNNYAMDEALRLYGLGEYPGQHLWGYPLAEASDGDAMWVIPGWSLYRWALLDRGALKTLRNGVVKLVGDPLQQAYVALHAVPGDVVYAADQRSGAILGLLRRARVFRRRLVVIVHHAPTRAWERACLGRVDAVMYLSEHVGERLERLLPQVPLRVLAPWGAHAASRVYDLPAVSTDLDFVSAGKTNRDYALLKSVAAAESLSGVIFEDGRVTTYNRGVATASPCRASYQMVLEQMNKAACVVIPLRDPAVMAGLTEVADAVALGKPVIVTRSEAFPYDLEGTGAGIVVDADDASALREAIASAVAGKAGSARVLGKHFNMRAFSDVLGTTLWPSMAEPSR